MHIPINRESNVPLTKQIYQGIKEMILSGYLAENTRLPSSRKLADDLGVSRIVIVDVYDMLTAEGYTRSQRGSGTFVNEHLQFTRPDIRKPDVHFSELEDQEVSISFRSGLPALNMFPRAKWLQSYRNALYDLPNQDLGYGLTSGHPSFRKTLADYLFRTRGILCHEDQIIVTTGAVQALFILMQFFQNKSGTMILEDPTNKSIRDMLIANDIDTHYTPVDSQGIQPGLLPKDKKIIGIIATPSHQYPLGGSLPVSRRLELVRYAREQSCYILEDDYDSEYRYSQAPVESLYELDPDHVIYLGSFSKILLPSIRIGYMVLPIDLIKSIHGQKRLNDIHCPMLNQLALERFISTGQLDQHHSKVKKIYGKRREVLIQSLKEQFGDKVQIWGSQTGIHLVASFQGVAFTHQLMDELESRGLYFLRVSDHSIQPKKHLSKLIFGYGNLDEKQIKSGIQILAQVLNQ